MNTQIKVNPTYRLTRWVVLYFRLMENTYTDDEVREMLTDIGNVIASEIECELINSSHTNVLVLQQVFAQAQKWHLDLDADLAELENRGQS